MYLVCITRDWDAQTQCPRWDNRTLQGSHRHRTQRACVMSALDWIPHGPAMPDLSWLRKAAFPANWLADRFSACVLVEVVIVAMVVILWVTCHRRQSAQARPAVGCCQPTPGNICPIYGFALQTTVNFNYLYSCLAKKLKKHHTTYVPSFALCINWSLRRHGCTSCIMKTWILDLSRGCRGMEAELKEKQF